MSRHPLQTRSLLWLGIFLAGCAAETAGPADLEASEVASSSEELVWPSKSQRIAIVGAGPSGLTAARTLEEQGYENVTVFERENRVGGKVYSLQSSLGVSELGAVFASPDYELVLGLADEYGIPYEQYETARGILDENDVVQSSESFLASRYSTGQLLGATVAYAGVLALYLQINLDGLAYLPRDLELPYIEFAKKYGIEPITELTRSVMVGFGYAYYEDAPAMYYMKLLPWLVKLGGEAGLQQAPYFTFPTGFQSIWDAVAGDLSDVRLNSEVTNIKRRKWGWGAPIEITINGTDTYDFDYVIVSAPLNVVGNFMDLTHEEDDLFSMVETERYFVNIFTSAGLPRNEVLFFHKNAFPNRINHTNVWASRDESPINVAYQIADRTSTPADVVGVLASDVASRGGAFGNILVQKEWEDYFPHVSTPALRKHFYERMEAIQGDNRTFYVGSTLSFETVEHSARFARSLVRRKFPTAIFR